MKQASTLVPLLRQFLMPFHGWPWLCYTGLALLPLVLVIGLFYPRVAFGLAVWDYIVLLAIPFAAAPKLLRTLLGNQHLGMVPGLQRSVILALLILTLLQSSFIGFFATLYDINGNALVHFRNAAQLFVANGIYIVIMQYAVTTRVALAVLSIFPLASVVAVIATTQGVVRDLPDLLIAALLLLSLAGWIYAAVYANGHHRFRPEHDSLLAYRFNEFQRPPLAQWLLKGGNALAAPEATLLLGYPANLLTRLRVTAYVVLTGPLVAAVLISAIGYGRNWDMPPSILDLLIGCSLMPAMFQAFQSVEWTARLRLIWLRRRALREELWQLLEKQILISVAVVTALALLVTAIGLLFSGIPRAVLLHYPVVVLLFNLFFGYYMVCARTAEWSTLRRLVTIWISTALMWLAIWYAINSGNSIGLYLLEVLAMLIAAGLRVLARRELIKVDWLKVKPVRSAGPSLSST